MNNGNCILHITNFDGPLELLWDLIKRSRFDIAVVPVARITEQYIAYLKLMENLNIKIASEFIWMASELLYYKSRALLPSQKIEDEEFTASLPPELIQKLLEYKKYQAASVNLKNVHEITSKFFIRKNSHPEFEDEYGEASVFDLIKAFADVIDTYAEPEPDEIIFDEILVSDRIELIRILLAEKDFLVFQDIFRSRPSRLEILATFLAVLEMTRLKQIAIMQHRVFGDIRIVKIFVRQGTTGE